MIAVWTHVSTGYSSGQRSRVTKVKITPEKTDVWLSIHGYKGLKTKFAMETTIKVDDRMYDQTALTGVKPNEPFEMDSEYVNLQLTFKPIPVTTKSFA